MSSDRPNTALHESIIDDGRRCGVPFCDTDISILRSISSSLLKTTLSSLGRALDQALVTGQFVFPTTVPDNLRSPNGLPILCLSVFSNIFTDEGRLRRQPFSTYIRYLRQLLLLDSKTWEYPTPMQSQNSWEEFKVRQSDLRLVTIPRNHPVIASAADILGAALQFLSLKHIVPGHGPGAVAEGYEKDERWEFSYWPLRAATAYPYWMYGVPRANLFDPKFHPTLRDNLSTRVVMVPKDFRGPRLISVEPSAQQYLQQGQMKKIYDYIESHPLLSRSISLRDQGRSRDRARNAWNDGSMTLDLSDASDRLSTSLVWRLLAKAPKVRRYLFRTRTPFATYRGERIRLSAFSPMGSAVCFPVETLCFWGLTMASLRFVTNWDVVRCADAITVFGDDIIVPDDCRDVLLGTLLECGCRPNMSKTCMDTPFRESCGAEYFDGFDISIVRNRNYRYGTLTINDIPALVPFQRNLFSAGLYKTAALVATMIREIFPVPSVPTLNDAEPDYLVSATLSNECCRTRWNRKLHRLEAQTYGYHRSSRAWRPMFGQGWLLNHLTESPIDRVPRRDIRVKLRWRDFSARVLGKESGA